MEELDFKMEKLKERLWLSFYIILLIILGIFIVIFGLVFPFWGEIDGFLYVLFLLPWKFSIIFISLSVVSFIYSIFLIINSPGNIKSNDNAKSKNIKKRRSKRKWGNILIFRILPIPLFMFWAIILLAIIIAGEDHIVLVLYHLELLSPLIFLGIVIFLSLMVRKFHIYIDTGTTIGKQSSPQKKTKAIIAITLISFAYLTAFAFPLIYPPSTISLYSTNAASLANPIPDKPIIIAHRGAAYLAPENTLPAGILTAEVGAAGWEVDVRISKDGEFYMMHDDSLIRTTNVADLFPERRNDDGETFLFSELRQLDAGSWFVDRDPFNAILMGKISKADAENYRGEKIPSLDEILNLTIYYDLIIDIDMKKPESSHPYYEVYESLLLTKLQESNLEKKIIYKTTSEQAENMTKLISYRDLGPNLENLSEMDIGDGDIIDEKYWISDRDLKIYKENNITIMAGVLDSTWRFSQLWMMGVEYILTDIPDVFVQMSQPILSISRTSYSLVWISTVFLIYGIAIIKSTLLKKRNWPKWKKKQAKIKD
ncbi:MAG: glycerophosphodiester phosphodiesterase family protein [Promethearchaeota archaeon]